MRVRAVLIRVWNCLKPGGSFLHRCWPKKKARDTGNLSKEEVNEVLRSYREHYQLFYQRYYQQLYQRLYREIYQVRTCQSEDYWAWYSAYNGSDVVVGGGLNSGMADISCGHLARPTQV